jgi:hypothetical protein
MSAVGGLRRRTIVVWLLLGALIAGIAYIEVRSRSQLPEEVAEHRYGAEGSRLLLPAPVDELAAIELGYAGVLHRFERDATGAWLYHGVHARAQEVHAHQTDPAQAQIIEKAFAALARTRMERQLELDVRTDAYGLRSPRMIIILYGKDNPVPIAQFAVGDVAPDGLSRYVLPVGGRYVVTIANYQVENLLGLIDAVAGGAAGTAAKPASP